MESMDHYMVNLYDQSLNGYSFQHQFPGKRQTTSKVENCCVQVAEGWRDGGWSHTLGSMVLDGRWWPFEVAHSTSECLDLSFFLDGQRIHIPEMETLIDIIIYTVSTEYTLVYSSHMWVILMTFSLCTHFTLPDIVSLRGRQFATPGRGVLPQGNGVRFAAFTAAREPQRRGTAQMWIIATCCWPS